MGPVLTGTSAFRAEDKMMNWKMHKGLMRSLQKTGCSHVLDVYCEGLTRQKGSLQQDAEFIDIQVSIASLILHNYLYYQLFINLFHVLSSALQYEAAWRAGNWDFSFFIPYSSHSSSRTESYCLFNENLHRFIIPILPSFVINILYTCELKQGHTYLYHCVEFTCYSN